MVILTIITIAAAVPDNGDERDAKVGLGSAKSGREDFRADCRRQSQSPSTARCVTTRLILDGSAVNSLHSGPVFRVAAVRPTRLGDNFP
jgi:hypothetical protein